MTAEDIAKYFLAKGMESDGDDLSNLKLQKLLYYAQGFHLALFDRPLFKARIAAWTHGPVVPSVYRQYKGYGSGPIQACCEYPTGFDEETIELLDEVYAVFGQFSAWKLRNMTHQEPPWKDAEGAAAEISHDAMRMYFRTRIV